MASFKYLLEDSSGDYLMEDGSSYYLLEQSYSSLSVGGLQYLKATQTTLPSGVLYGAGGIYTSGEYTAVLADDSSYAQLSGSGVYNIHQFQTIGSSSSSAITLTWDGQASRAGSVATIFLQIYNVNSSVWETISSNNTVSANTDFTLSGVQSTSTSNYYDSDLVVTARVYQ